MKISRPTIMLTFLVLAILSLVHIEHTVAAATLANSTEDSDSSLIHRAWDTHSISELTVALPLEEEEEEEDRHQHAVRQGQGRAASLNAIANRAGRNANNNNKEKSDESLKTSWSLDVSQVTICLNSNGSSETYSGEEEVTESRPPAASSQDDSEDSHDFFRSVGSVSSSKDSSPVTVPNELSNEEMPQSHDEIDLPTVPINDDAALLIPAPQNNSKDSSPVTDLNARPKEEESTSFGEMNFVSVSTNTDAALLIEAAKSTESSSSVETAMIEAFAGTQEAGILPDGGHTNNFAMSLSLNESKGEIADENAGNNVNESANNDVAESASNNFNENSNKVIDENATKEVDESANNDFDESTNIDLDENTNKVAAENATKKVDESANNDFDESTNVDLDENTNEVIDENATKKVDESANNDFDESANIDLDENTNKVAAENSSKDVDENALFEEATESTSLVETVANELFTGKQEFEILPGKGTPNNFTMPLTLIGSAEDNVSLDQWTELDGSVIMASFGKPESHSQTDSMADRLEDRDSITHSNDSMPGQFIHNNSVPFGHSSEINSFNFDHLTAGNDEVIKSDSSIKILSTHGVPYTQCGQTWNSSDDSLITIDLETATSDLSMPADHATKIAPSEGTTTASANNVFNGWTEFEGPSEITINPDMEPFQSDAELVSRSNHSVPNYTANVATSIVLICADDVSEEDSLEGSIQGLSSNLHLSLDYDNVGADNFAEAQASQNLTDSANTLLPNFMAGENQTENSQRNNTAAEDGDILHMHLKENSTDSEQLPVVPALLVQNSTDNRAVDSPVELAPNEAAQIDMLIMQPQGENISAEGALANVTTNFDAQDEMAAGRADHVQDLNVAESAATLAESMPRAVENDPEIIVDSAVEHAPLASVMGENDNMAEQIEGEKVSQDGNVIANVPLQQSHSGIGTASVETEPTQSEATAPVFIIANGDTLAPFHEQPAPFEAALNGSKEEESTVVNVDAADPARNDAKDDTPLEGDGAGQLGILTGTAELGNLAPLLRGDGENVNAPLDSNNDASEAASDTRPDRPDRLASRECPMHRDISITGSVNRAGSATLEREHCYALANDAQDQARECSESGQKSPRKVRPRIEHSVGRNDHYTISLDDWQDDSDDDFSQTFSGKKLSLDSKKPTRWNEMAHSNTGRARMAHSATHHLAAIHEEFTEHSHVAIYRDNKFYNYLVIASNHGELHEDLCNDTSVTPNDINLAFIAAAYDGELAIVQMLLLNHNIHENSWAEALEKAAVRGHYQIIYILLFSVHATLDSVSFALHHACAKGQLEVVKTILSFEHVYVKNLDLPSRYARKMDQVNVLNFLQEEIQWRISNPKKIRVWDVAENTFSVEPLA